MEALKSTITRSQVHLALAKADGNEDAAQWHAEMIQAAKDELAAVATIEAERCTLALQSKRSRRMLDVAGPLFAEPGLFGGGQ